MFDLSNLLNGTENTKELETNYVQILLMMHDTSAHNNVPFEKVLQALIVHDSFQRNEISSFRSLQRWQIYLLCTENMFC